MPATLKMNGSNPKNGDLAQKSTNPAQDITAQVVNGTRNAPTVHELNAVATNEKDLTDAFAFMVRHIDRVTERAVSSTRQAIHSQWHPFHADLMNVSAMQASTLRILLVAGLQDVEVLRGDDG